MREGDYIGLAAFYPCILGQRSALSAICLCSFRGSRRRSAAPRAGRSVQMCPRGPETDRSTVDEQCLSCQLGFPAWPPLLKHPSQPPPPALCMATLLPVDSPLSGLSHATVSNHSAHPPRTQRVGPHHQPAPQDRRGGSTPPNLCHFITEAV